jgi:hypothetical protein
MPAQQRRASAITFLLDEDCRMRFLHWLCRFLSGLAVLARGHRSSAKGRSQPRVSLRLEALEDRTVPTVTYHGGALLSSVEAQGVYLGDLWQTDPILSAQTSYLESYLGSVVSGSYMDALTNAGYNVGRGTSSAGYLNPVALTAGSTVTDASIRDYISAGITGATLAAPDANSLYVVFVEQNIIVSMGGSTSRSFRGYHGAYTGPVGGLPVRYAVVAYPRGSVNNASVTFLADIDSITKTTSHEIAEAATDPDVQYRTQGWTDGGSEIGDINNDRVATLNGFVIQRVIDTTDHNMTPAGASANAAMSFVLTAAGQLSKVTGAGTTLISSGVASVSDQSIDNMGHVMVGFVGAYGTAKEYHDGGSLVTVRSGARAIATTVGATYVLGANGTVYEHDDALGGTTTLDSNAASINAGTDMFGVNEVGIVYNDGTAKTRSDASGFHTIASNVAAISVGQQGVFTYLTTDGSAYLYNEQVGTASFIDSGITQITVGSDETGNYQLEILYGGGTAFEYRAGTDTWTGLWTDTSGGVAATSLGKARVGLVDVVFNSGDGWEHTLDGYTTLLNSGNTVAAV